MGGGPAATRSRPADRIFAGSTLLAGIVILTALAAVAVFLIAQSIPALIVDPAALPTPSSSFWAYVAPLAFGTVSKNRSRVPAGNNFTIKMLHRQSVATTI